MGQDPGQQGTQWGPSSGTHSAAMPMQPGQAGTYLGLKAASAQKWESHLLAKVPWGCRTEASASLPQTTSQNAEASQQLFLLMRGPALSKGS